MIKVSSGGFPIEREIMAVTKIDKVAAVVIIDLQKGITSFPTVHPISGIIARSAELARVFRQRGLPVVLVNVTGSAPGRTDYLRTKVVPATDWAELVPELDRHPDDFLVSKQRTGAFIGTPLDDFLRKRGVTQIILTGVATSVGVESTARSAYDLGYNVVLASDAMTDRDADVHRNSVEKIFPRLGEVDTTENVMKMLDAALSQ
jgi:nicotinamidase-related amidase